MKYGYTEKRILSKESLRRLCIDEGYFTRGTSEEYDAFLKLADKENITTDDIFIIAERIAKYSRRTEETITAIMFRIARVCVTLFQEV